MREDHDQDQVTPAGAKETKRDRLRSGDQLDGDVRRNDQSPESGGDDSLGASWPLQLAIWIESGMKLTLLMRLRAIGQSVEVNTGNGDYNQTVMSMDPRTA
ncbi:5184_t:CDS:2 [Acaulospora colombiana]|uniref:5184_t:CDS:1 n=1 Tax=Acaulospora colombiana TaxID=27376 RepID=A0ACA9M2E0_9GLOM|nr:5184_t:CDS:2 [Acaulospora colombiana]